MAAENQIEKLFASFDETSTKDLYEILAHIVRAPMLKPGSERDIDLLIRMYSRAVPLGPKVDLGELHAWVTALSKLQQHIEFWCYELRYEATFIGSKGRGPGTTLEKAGKEVRRLGHNIGYGILGAVILVFILASYDAPTTLHLLSESFVNLWQDLKTLYESYR